MKRMQASLARLVALLLLLAVAGAPARADTLSFFDGSYGSLQGTLQSLGYNTSDPAIETTAQTYTAAGAPGTTTRLDFTFVQDVGGYQFSFGIFDYGAVTANPVTDRILWGMQALSAATLVFDNREVEVDDTMSIDVAAGAQLGFFLIPDDTLADILENPEDFYDGSRPDPLFSVSDANPGAYDQMLAFQSGSLFALAFEDLTRTGWSDQDFNDLVITMQETVSDQLVERIETIPEPPGLALLFLMAGVLLRRHRRRVRP